VAQVVADALGVEPAEITVATETDTSLSAWTIASGNYSSRFSGVGVGAVLSAAENLADKLLAIAGQQLGAEPDEVELRDGGAQLRDDPEARVPLRRLAGMAHWNPEGLPANMTPGLAATAFYSAPELPPASEDDQISASGENGFVVDIAVVEVDRATGRLTVIDYVSVHDAGRLLNPLLAEGQVLGGFAGLRRGDAGTDGVRRWSQRRIPLHRDVHEPLGLLPVFLRSALCRYPRGPRLRTRERREGQWLIGASPHPSNSRARTLAEGSEPGV
jgi:xanthine dehydrogenase molybdopterin-binding subunit B